MPLILHESSTCDVCLDVYGPTSDDGPHAIPCGHIFCRACLLNVEPTNCPLCRKAFNRERIKKLHVDRPESDVERAFLRRFALAFDADDAVQAGFTEELRAWLAPHSDDDHVTLRKAWAAFRMYITLLDKRKKDKMTIRRYAAQLESVSEENETARDTFKGVEASLLTQISELTAQIADLEAQVFPLRNELSKYQHSSNPLPAPPEPVPLDRFPTFARATAESKEGYAAYFSPAGAPSLFPNNILPHADPPVENDKGKGKGKQRQALYELPSGNLIIPGASPSQRVIPTDDVNGHAYHTHAPASAFVDGYGSGFGMGYGAANAGLQADENYASTSNYASASSYQFVQRPAERDDSLENAMGSLQLWGMPSASAAAIAPVVTRPPESAPANLLTRRRRPYIESSYASTADDTSISSQTDTSHTRPHAFRRSTVQPDGHLTNGHAPTTWQPPPSIYGPPAPPPHPQSDAPVRFHTDENPPLTHEAIARRAVRERNRQSYSSWGTVHTNDSPGTRGSMSDLGLANFPHPGGQRNSVSSAEGILDRGLVSTPRPDDPRLPLGFADVATEPAHRPAHAHRYSLPANSLPMLEAAAESSYDTNSLQRSTRVNNRQRTVPRRFSQLPTNASSEFGLVAPLPIDPPPIANALGLELGMEAAAPMAQITAPTPRVGMTHFLRSFSHDSTAV